MDWTQKLHLRKLKMLLSLAQTRNISHSASMLNITQPGLSKWLKDLEEDIGLQLFERHARGLFPTPYGEALIAHARRIDAQLDRASNDMQALRSGGRRILIGTAGEPSAETIPLAIILLLNRMPHVRVKVVEGMSEQLLAQLVQGDLDIVVGRYAPEHHNPALLSEALYLEPIHFVARPQHPLFAQAQIRWQDLEHYRWIVWPRGTATRQALDAAIDTLGEPLPDDALETNSISTTLALIANSDMIGVASHRAALHLTRMHSARIVPVHLPGFASIALYWQHDTFLPQAVQATLECLRQAAARAGRIRQAPDTDAPTAASPTA